MREFLSAVQVWCEYIAIGALLRIGWLLIDRLTASVKSLFRRHD